MRPAAFAPTPTRVVLLVGLSLAVAGCADQPQPTSPDGSGGPTVSDVMNSDNGLGLSVTCTADVAAGDISCGDVPVLEGEPGSQPQQIVFGGQGLFVDLISSPTSISYDGAIFEADVWVRNRIPQGIGTANGFDLTGVRVFFITDPVVTSGTGTVTVNNPDDFGTFTAPNQPFFQYDQFLHRPFLNVFFSESSPKLWKWNVPSTVGTFAFEVAVDADVVFPNGFVMMTPASAELSVGVNTVTVAGVAVDAVGQATSSPVTYTSADESIATVDLNSGLVTPQAAGVVDIIGSTGGPEADGRTRVTIDPSTAGYDILWHFVSAPGLTQDQLNAFTNAAARWEGLITADLPTDVVSSPFLCGGETLDEVVDDLAVNVIVTSIDGPSGTLAQAGPCWARSTSGLPSFGQMFVDSDDIGNAQLEDVIIHELGHILGIGTLWIDFNLLSDQGPVVLETCPDTPVDPFFSGTRAVAAFNEPAIGGAGYAGNKVPVEDGGGAGTICRHWREDPMDDELMTGFIENAPTANPLSKVTVESLGDMGYTVATSGWDSWSCVLCAPPALGSPTPGFQAGQIELVNDVLPGPVYTRNEQGELVVFRRDRR